MAWNIIRRMHPNEPNRHNRLWIKDEIEDILVNKSGTEAIRSIQLDYSDLQPAIIMNGLKRMKELRYLNVRGGYRKWKVNKVGGYFPDSLRSLCWHGYPYRSFVKTFRANKLVTLGMCWSTISQPREVREIKVIDKLKYLDLGGSKLRTFDLAMTPHLETLDFAQCIDFVELHMPNECPNLKFIDLSASKVSNLNLGMTPHLEELNLEDCSYLQDIHAPVGCLKKLVYLDLSGCLRFENFLVNKWNATPGLDSLAKLELNVQSLDICPLHPDSNLPKFQFSCEYVEPLSSWNGNIEKLISFGLCACTNLESLSAAICGLQNVRELKIEGIIPEVPKDLGQIQSLEKLTLTMEEIRHLPDSICKLKRLKYLRLESCLLLELLPKDIGLLENLEVLNLAGCITLQDMPDSITMMKCLKYLDLRLCILVPKLPDEVGRLQCLKVLDILGVSIICLPQSIYQLKGLHIYGSMGQLESYGFTSVIEISEDFYYVEL